MKKIFAWILIFGLFAFATAIPVCALTDEQLKNYFYKNERVFSLSGALDWQEIKFHYDESSQYYEWMCYDEAWTNEIDKGNFSIKGGKLYMESKRGKPLTATVEGLEKEVPHIDYSAKLILEGYSNDFKGHSPEAGEKVYYRNAQFIKTYYSIITDKVYITYMEPDENSDYYISNRIYKDSHNKYKDVGGYRIMPGIGLSVYGEYGNWLLVKDNFESFCDEKNYAWIHVDNAKKMKHYEKEFSQLEVQEGYQDLFDNSKGFLTPLTDKEIDRINNKKGYELYYDFYCIFNGAKHTKKMDNLNINCVKTLNDNLRLRSSSDLKSKVLVTLKKGSTVRITETGNRDVIDNIYSKWVKVEVVSGKDRDGKPINSGLTGWCYGGYLSN